MKIILNSGVVVDERLNRAQRLIRLGKAKIYEDNSTRLTKLKESDVKEIDIVEPIPIDRYVDFKELNQPLKKKPKPNNESNLKYRQKHSSQ